MAEFSYVAATESGAREALQTPERAQLRGALFLWAGLVSEAAHETARVNKRGESDLERHLELVGREYPPRDPHEERQRLRQVWQPLIVEPTATSLSIYMLGAWDWGPSVKWDISGSGEITIERKKGHVRTGGEGVIASPADPRAALEWARRLVERELQIFVFRIPGAGGQKKARSR